MKEKIRIHSIDEGPLQEEKLPVNYMVKPQLGKRWLLIILLAFVFGGIGAVAADRFLYPYLLTFSRFRDSKILNYRDNKVVVEKKETIRVEEDNFVADLVKKVRPHFVTIAPKGDLENHLLRVTKMKSEGKGVALSSDGLVLTTREVVSKSGKYSVVTDTGKIYEVKDIYNDPASEAVFLKTNAEGLAPAELANFDDLNVGNHAIGLENLLLNNSGDVALANLAHKSRALNFEANAEKLDVSVALAISGNSDYRGPIFDYQGKLLGLVTKKDGNMFLAIPAYALKNPMKSVLKDKRVSRVKMGIKYFTVTPEFALYKKLAKTSGAYLPQYAVTDAVEKNGPADKAGLEPGDLIFSLDGREISPEENYFKLLQSRNAGEEVEIGYVRGEKEGKVKVKLVEQK